MRLSDPLGIELEYVRRMMVWLLVRDDTALPDTRAVQLGLGAGAITRFCCKRLQIRTLAVELNPSVIDACRRWFRLPDDSDLLEVIEMNAADFVADPARHGSADVLSVDLYDHEAASPVLDSAEFYRGCFDVLAAGGAMTVNLFGREASYERTVRRIAAAFGDDAVRTLKPTTEGNAIVLAMKQVTLPGRDELARRAENIETRWEAAGPPSGYA